MSVNYHCTVCGAEGNSDREKPPCVHGYRFQQVGFRTRKARSIPSKVAKQLVWNQGVDVAKKQS